MDGDPAQVLAHAQLVERLPDELEAVPPNGKDLPRGEEHLSHVVLVVFNLGCYALVPQLVHQGQHCLFCIMKVVGELYEKSRK